MNWVDEVSVKLKKKNQILFSKDSEFLQDLKTLMETQSHRVLTLWAFDFASESIAKLEENIRKKSAHGKHWKPRKTGHPEQSKCELHNEKY